MRLSPIESRELFLPANNVSLSSVGFRPDWLGYTSGRSSNEGQSRWPESRV
jgi:hypothetical protein